MKRLTFLILLSLIVINIQAQTTVNKKISYATTIGTGISFNKPASTPFIWQVIAYYNLTDRWAAGAGTGLAFYEKALIPIIADVRFQIGRERMFTPYLELGAGYSFASSGDANGGFFMNPSLGIRYGLKNKMKLQFAVGYETQKLERLKKQMDVYFHKEFKEQLNHNSISIKVGLVF